MKVLTRRAGSGGSGGERSKSFLSLFPFKPPSSILCKFSRIKFKWLFQPTRWVFRLTCASSKVSAKSISHLNIISKNKCLVCVLSPEYIITMRKSFYKSYVVMSKVFEIENLVWAKVFIFGFQDKHLKEATQYKQAVVIIFFCLTAPVNTRKLYQRPKKLKEMNTHFTG